MSDGAQETALPALEEVVTGKTEIEVTNTLLNFVQTAFEYKMDDDQFG